MTSILSVIAAPRRTTRQSLLAAAYFAAQLASASAILCLGYHWSRAPGAAWAIVSAVLILYPGITQSFSAALLRIAANLLGSIIGFGIGYFFGTNIPEVILALVVVVFVGELLRMDLALRTACVAAVIVMTANDHNIRLSTIERLTAVCAGCLSGLLIQVSFRPLHPWLPFIAQTRPQPLPAPAPAPTE
ncbi:MAG: FUSC family protein [Tepidisphaeraceae bacterium]